MELWVGALNLGFLYAFMTMGVFITSRIFDFPDVTVDGSFATGGAIAAVLIASGYDPATALAAAFVFGAIAGCATAVIHTRLNINGLLAGILVMTALYSINLHIMGRSNIPLLHQTTFFTGLEKINPGLPNEVWYCMSLFVILSIFWVIASLFFKTDMGIAMRATGNNAVMSSASGVNVNLMKIFGVALANGFVGVSGGLVAQYQGFADIGMGIGTIVIGMASVIIGESVIRFRSMYAKIGGVIVGSLLFRLMIAGALMVGMNPIDLKLLTAVFVLLTLIVSKLLAQKPKEGGWVEKIAERLASVRWKYAAAGFATLFSIIAIIAHLNQKPVEPSGTEPEKQIKIGVVQVSDHGLLNITRDSFMDEIKQLGYESGRNCEIDLENANGELATVNTIIDRFIQNDVDLVVTISTPCTQTAINKIKDKPIVFATVANPFIISAGKTDADHQSNVTGVYGGVPMDRFLDIVRNILPGELKAGAIWDPAQANSVFNVEQLQAALKKLSKITFEGANVANSSEVYQAAQSLVQKGVNVFTLSPDNIVYSAFESIVKAAQSKKIPIFTCDVERLPDGALGTLGYDYTSSGVQAAHLVDRILKGENPKDIPFEVYKKITIGYNLDTAKELGIQIPPEFLEHATVVVEGKKIVKGTLGGKVVKNASSAISTTPASAPAPTAVSSTPTAVPPSAKRLALVMFSENLLMTNTQMGVLDALKESGVLEKYNIKIDQKNAQNEFSMAQSIAQEVVASNYDFLLTLSTPVLQVCAQVNQKIPHVFGAVTDPYRMGVAKSPEDHIPNITGVATFQPVENAIRILREAFPRAKTIGYVWNPAEACSEACTEKARAACKKFGFKLVEANVSSTNEVIDAVKSLVASKVNLFYTAGDNTVSLVVESVAEILRPSKIPYMTNAFSDVERGAFITLGADYYEVGQEVGRMAIRVINGEKPQDIPINNYVPQKMYLNLALAKEYGVKLSDDFVKKAAKVKE